MRLYDELPCSVVYGDAVYALDLSYTAVLAAFDALEDDELSAFMQVDTALGLLVLGDHPCEIGLLKAIVEIVTPRNERQKNRPPVIDFHQDWPYIYAGFRQAYGIDLFEDRGLHWLLFLALLRSLPQSTRMAKIIGIRDQPLPKPTKYNADEIARLTRLKAEYAIRRSESGSFEAGLRKIFEALKAQAQEGR